MNTTTFENWNIGKEEAGFTLLDVLGALVVGLLVIAGIATIINNTYSHSKLVDTEQNLIAMRMQIQQLFSGSPDYTGLDNALAIKAGMAPKNFIKGNTLGNAWGGSVNLASVPADAAFSIEFTGIPQDECTKLARFQSDAWLSVTVNSTSMRGGTVEDAANACVEMNTLVFVTR